jgi:hypothetical protein
MSAALQARPAPSPPTLFVGIGGTFVIAGGLVAAVNSAAPFAHGSWLAAYLVLVAGVAQITLGVAAAALAPADRSARLAPAQLLLWNVGSLAVPAGVLVTERVMVALGSIALLAALAAFAACVRRASAGPARIGYQLLIGALAISVLVGSTLGDAAPAGWLR